MFMQKKKKAKIEVIYDQASFEELD